MAVSGDPIVARALLPADLMPATYQSINLHFVSLGLIRGVNRQRL